MKGNVHIVLTWDTESCCRSGFFPYANYQRDWVEATRRIEEVCERYGVPATFMVNFGEIDYWAGESPKCEDVVKEMATRGHDVQLHIHTAWAFWLCEGAQPWYDPTRDFLDDGLRKFPVGDKQTPWTQKYFIARGIARLAQITGIPPLFYRDVNYDIDTRVAQALWDEGILADGTIGYGMPSSYASSTPGALDLVKVDTVPDRAYYPDVLDIRKEGKPGQALPILEIPNTCFVSGKGFERFQFTKPAQTLRIEFDKWYAKHKHEPIAILCFVSHQKNEIYDMRSMQKPYELSKQDSLRNMEEFFRYVRENYDDKGVRFSSAREAILEYRKIHPPPFDTGWKTNGLT